MLAASWIQFENHDWINHGEVVTNEIVAIPLAEDDPARKKFWRAKMFVSKTQPDPTVENSSARSRCCTHPATRRATWRFGGQTGRPRLRATRW